MIAIVKDMMRKPFSPLSLGPSLWLDGSDASSHTTVSDAISQAADKSGNGKHATQTTAAYRPTLLGSAQNSLSVLRFDGSDDGLISSLILNPISYPNITVLTVHRLHTIPTYYDPVFSTDGNTGGWNRGMGYYNSDLQAQTSDSSGFYFGIGHSVGTFRIVGIEYQGTTNMYSLVNGARTARGSGEASLQNRNHNWEIAQATVDSGQRAPIDLGDFFVFSRALSTSDRQQMEGYLAWKWGLQSSLSSGHPYKNNAP